jgi:hypothetical protein
MPRHISITPEKEQEILAALTRDSHASRVARTLGDVSYATVWRVANGKNADGKTIDLEAGRAAKGYKRPGGTCRKNRSEPVDSRPGGARAAWRFGGDAMRSENRGAGPTGLAYCVRRSPDGCVVVELHPGDREQILASGLAIADAEDPCIRKIDELRGAVLPLSEDPAPDRSTRRRKVRQLAFKL